MANKIPPEVKPAGIHGTEETHESYGIIGIHRHHAGMGGVNLFGSAIHHHTIFNLAIRRAVKVRDLNTDHFHCREILVEVDLSPTQIIDLMTTMNCGDGIPCTLRIADGREMDACPEFNQRQVFEDEFKEDLQITLERALTLIAGARRAFNKESPTKTERKKLVESLEKIEQDLRSNFPFVQKQFAEAMEKTTTEATAQVEAFIGSKILSMGLEAFQSNLRGMLPEVKVEQRRIEENS